MREAGDAAQGGGGVTVLATRVGGLLEQIDRARAALDEVETVEEAIRVADFAESVRYASRQAKVGMDAENAAAEIRLRAERRAGQLLAEMPKQTGGDAMRARSHDATELPPKLSDVGVSKSQSSRYQQVADVPQDTFEGYIASNKAHSTEITTKRLLRLGRERKADLRRRERALIVGSLPQTVELRHGDFREVLDDLAGCADAIITDPPYGREHDDLYPALAALAARLLAPAGSLVVLCGTRPNLWLRRLPEMEKHLPLRWVGCYLTPGAAWRDRNLLIATNWKPLLIFGGDRKLNTDVFRSSADDKAHHHWGQNEDAFAQIVEAFTDPGDLVVDPFLGGGTTGVVAHDLGRRFVGCEVDEAVLVATEERLVA